MLTVPFVYPEHLKPYDFRRFTSNGIKILMESKGFQLIKCEKTGNFIEAVTQMRNVYFNEKMFNGTKKYRTIKRIGISLINLRGFVLSKILNNDKYLYLDNIVIAMKM